MRLIDSTRLILESDGESVPLKDIVSAPTIDAVEVVRCKDCKYHREKNKFEREYLVEDVLICSSPDATDDCWNPVYPNHFCSYGQRKETKDE